MNTFDCLCWVENKVYVGLMKLIHNTNILLGKKSWISLYGAQDNLNSEQASDSLFYIYAKG